MWVTPTPPPSPRPLLISFFFSFTSPQSFPRVTRWSSTFLRCASLPRRVYVDYQHVSYIYITCIYRIYCICSHFLHACMHTFIYTVHIQVVYSYTLTSTYSRLKDIVQQLNVLCPCEGTWQVNVARTLTTCPPGSCRMQQELFGFNSIGRLQAHTDKNIEPTRGISGRPGGVVCV